MNEIDLIMLRNGAVNLIECKSGMMYNASDVKAFGRLENSDYKIGPPCIICTTDKPYPIKDNVYALPITVL